MKKIFLLLFILSLTVSPTYGRTFGLGAILGDPTGLSGKYFMSNAAAIDAVISYGHHEFIFYGDYLKHFPGAFGRQNAFVSSLNPFIGIGPVFAFSDEDKHHDHRFIDDDDDDFAFGGRIPFGIEWLPKEIPIGISLEIAPGLALIPETDGFVQGGLSLRYYFN